MAIHNPRPGELYIYAACRPPLPAGDYVLEVGHRLLDSGGDPVDTGSRALPSPHQQNISLRGPRFSLGPTDIHALFPPQNAEGRFTARFPMAVLSRRTLPWERTIDGSVPGPTSVAAPWLALLIFDATEVNDGAGVTDMVSFLEPPACTVGMVINERKEAHLVGPLITAADELSQTCLATELPLSLFKRLAPMESELPFLTHVRQVNTDDKELLGVDEDGWFAVVMSNRLPEAGQRYTACLVSLEGIRRYLPTAAELATMAAQPEPGPLAPLPRLRLVTLARWTFACLGGGDFQALMEALPHRDEHHGGVGLLGDSEHAMPRPGSPNPTLVSVDTGHLPIPHLTRAGEETIAWYRGPFVPFSVTREATGPYHSSDQARRIDPMMGLENLGYAAAFEIGRLLALSDPRFAAELLRWRRMGGHLLARTLNSKTLRQRLPDFLDLIDPAQFLVLPANLMTRVLAEVGERIVAGNVMGPLADPTGLAAQTAKIPGLDPTQVAQATQLDPALLNQLFGGAMMGISPRLDTLGVRAAAILPSDFATLGANAIREFGALAAARDRMLATTGRGGL